MKNKPSYWKTVFSAIKEARQVYRQQVQETKDKYKLLNSKSNWSMVEKWVQECNENPNLKVTIRLLDGTTLILTAYKPEKTNINQMLDTITVEAD